MAKGVGASTDLSQQLFHYMFAKEKHLLSEGKPWPHILSRKRSSFPSHAQSVGLTEEGFGKQVLDLVGSSVSQSFKQRHLSAYNMPSALRVEPTRAPPSGLSHLP